MGTGAVRGTIRLMATGLLVVGALATNSPASAEPAAAEPSQGPGCTKLAVIGDSLTYGAAPFLVADLTAEGIYDFAVDAERGRQIRATAAKSGVRALQALRKQGFLPDCFVVALGTNDITVSADPVVYGTWIDEMMAEIGDWPVLWVNVARPLPPGRALSFNEMLLARQVQHPKLQVADWAGVLAPHPEWVGPDFVHLYRAGYVARAQWLADQIMDRLFGVAPPDVVPQCSITRRLKNGTVDDDVTCLETRLEQLGFAMPGGPDRRFDLVTARAVAKFQHRHWLAPSGIVGSATASALGLGPS